MTSGFSNNGAIPNPFGNTSSGIIGAINNATGMSSISDPGNSPPGTIGGFDRQPTLGTNPGMIAPTTPVKSTTDTQGNTTTYHAPKSDPNVLAQQQWLNSQGAGLVEDGISGPKTAAAIAKYGTQSSPISQNNNSYTSQGGAVITNGQITTPAPNVAPATGVAPTAGTSTGGQIQNVSNAGTQTPAEAAAAGAISTASNQGNAAQENQAYNQALQNEITIQAAQQNAQLAPYAGSQNNLSQGTTNQLGTNYSNIFRPQSTANLQGEEGLLNPLLSQAGTAAAGTMAGILPEQQLATQGATALQTGAQNTASRGLSAQQGILGAVAPLANTPYALNPANGTYTGSGTNSGTSAVDAVTNAGMLSGLQSGAAAQAATGGNIAAQNATSLGTAETAANAQSIGNYTDQNTTISNSTAKLDNIAMGNNGSNGLIANMGTTGFNPASTPIGNQTYSQYFTNSNPAAKSGILAGLGEIQNQISNVISSSTGLTPTAVSAITNSYDLSTLNPEQLNDFLLYIKSYAQSNIAANQTTIDRLKSGGSVSGTPSLLPAPAPNSTGQAVVGTGATLGADLIGKIVSEAGNAVAGATAGAASGLAKSVLGI